MGVSVGTMGIGEAVKDAVGVAGDEPNASGLHDANESSRMSLHNVLTLMFLPKRAA